MNFKSILSHRIGIDIIHEVTCQIQRNSKRKQELYDLLFDKDDVIAYQAAWVMTHSLRRRINGYMGNKMS